MSEPQTWTEVVAPIVRTLEVGAMLKQKVSYTPDGADAMGELIKRMAERLDSAIERLKSAGIEVD